MTAAPLERHDLLVLDPAAWRHIVCPHLEGLAIGQRSTVLGWAEAGWPLVVRRLAGCEAPGTLAVGLPLPPGLGKRRLALALPPDVRWRVRRRVGLDEARTVAPARFQPAIDQVLAVVGRLGRMPDVFGALLWEKLTGLAYLHSGSDLDLLWSPNDLQEARNVAAELAKVEASCGLRLDGELLFQQGGVNWREFLGDGSPAARTVLVKAMSSASLVSPLALTPRTVAA